MWAAQARAPSDWASDWARAVERADAHGVHAAADTQQRLLPAGLVQIDAGVRGQFVGVLGIEGGASQALEQALADLAGGLAREGRGQDAFGGARPGPPAWPAGWSGRRSCRCPPRPAPPRRPVGPACRRVWSGAWRASWRRPLGRGAQHVVLGVQQHAHAGEPGQRITSQEGSPSSRMACSPWRTCLATSTAQARALSRSGRCQIGRIETGFILAQVDVAEHRHVVGRVGPQAVLGEQRPGQQLVERQLQVAPGLVAPAVYLFGRFGRCCGPCSPAARPGRWIPRRRCGRSAPGSRGPCRPTARAVRSTTPAPRGTQPWRAPAGFFLGEHGQASLGGVDLRQHRGARP
ncbi:MAG: hypothetical protein KatS3mg103_0284 [Phycisphaerales bacterium]|nr:MAG: hypothetical protein KatS3mg103_0284 [Phycisphaerales bacterium]